MPDETTGREVTVRSVRVVEPPPVPEIYANNVTPVVTSFDVTLHFGTIIEVANNEAKVARRVSIVLTPEVAKLMILQLSAGLTHYEKSVRPIPLHGQMVPIQPPVSQPTE